MTFVLTSDAEKNIGKLDVPLITLKRTKSKEAWPQIFGHAYAWVLNSKLARTNFIFSNAAKLN